MNKHTSKSSLFLIELVLSIFFFILATSICLQLFVNSFFLSRETIETNHAVLWSQNLAEPFLGSNGDYSVLKKLYVNEDCISELSFTPDNNLLLCFSQDWHHVTTLSDSSYIVFSSFQSDNTYAYQNIYIAKNSNHLTTDVSYEELITTLSNNNNSIYQLTVKKFIH